MAAISVKYTKKHTETCVFKEWSKNERKFVDCNIKAVGKLGKDPLCGNHFDYACSLSGVKYLTEDER